MDAADAVLVIVRDENPGGCGEDARLVRGRLEAGIGHEVQCGFVRRGFEDGPDKACRQEPEQVINLLIVVRVFGHLLFLRMRVAEELLDEGQLLGLRKPAAVFDKQAIHVAVRGGRDPLQELLLGFDGVIEIDLLGVVVLICCALRIDDLLDQLLRRLRAHRGDRKREDGECEEFSAARHGVWMPVAEERDHGFLFFGAWRGMADAAVARQYGFYRQRIPGMATYCEALCCWGLAGCFMTACAAWSRVELPGCWAKRERSSSSWKLRLLKRRTLPSR